MDRVKRHTKANKYVAKGRVEQPDIGAEHPRDAKVEASHCDADEAEADREAMFLNVCIGDIAAECSPHVAAFEEEAI